MRSGAPEFHPPTEILESMYPAILELDSAGQLVLDVDAGGQKATCPACGDWARRLSVAQRLAWHILFNELIVLRVHVGSYSCTACDAGLLGRGHFTLPVPGLHELDDHYSDAFKQKIIEAYDDRELGGSIDKAACIIGRDYNLMLERKHAERAVRARKRLAATPDAGFDPLLSLPRHNPMVAMVAASTVVTEP